MQRQALNSQPAPAVRFTAFGADARLIVSAEVLRAVQDAFPMPECTCCRRERAAQHQEPRQLERLPTEVTQCKEFKRKGLPVQLCPYCDDEALEMALAAHARRTGNR